jgi:hypothetical protein
MSGTALSLIPKKPCLKLGAMTENFRFCRPA